MERIETPDSVALARSWLHACLCAPYDPGSPEHARACASKAAFDWAATLELAQKEWVLPLVYENARRFDLIPSPVAPQWQTRQLRYVQRNLYLVHQLKQILAALGAADIPVLALKGAAFALTLYESPSLRPMRDLDLLIHFSDVERARAVMQTLGFCAHQTEPQPGAQLRFENELTLRKEGSAPFLADLHWNLIDSPYYQARVHSNWFWETAREVQVNETRLRVPGIEAQLLYACAHLWLHHRGDELLWLNDVHLMLRAGAAPPDWEELFARASEFAWTVPLSRTLRLLRDEWHTSLPATVNQWLETAHVPPQELKPLARTRDRASAGRRFWNDLIMMRSWRQRAAFLAVNLFPSREYMRRRYRLSNPVRVGLAYPYRWWRGISDLRKR